MSSFRKSSARTTRPSSTIPSPGPTVRIINQQRREGVPAAWLRRVARRAMARLNIAEQGIFVVAFVDEPVMRRLNRRFTGHRGLTDVLSFRYPNEPVIGEVIVSPAAARLYAAGHGLPYRQELARYLLHGVLHWLGHDDCTAAQRRRMRARENDLLRRCAA